MNENENEKSRGEDQRILGTFYMDHVRHNIAFVHYYER